MTRYYPDKHSVWQRHILASHGPMLPYSRLSTWLRPLTAEQVNIGRKNDHISGSPGLIVLTLVVADSWGIAVTL